MTVQQRGCRTAVRSTRRGRRHDASRVRRTNGRTAEGSRSRRAAQGDGGARRGCAARPRCATARGKPAGSGWRGQGRVVGALYRGDKSLKVSVTHIKC